MKKNKFVIISYQRTDSTFFAMTLNKMEGVVCHSELFNSDKQAFKNSIFDPGILPSENFLDKVMGITREDKLFKLKNKNPEKFLQRIFNQHADTIGFKIFPGQNDSILDLIISDKDVKKILLGRKNLLRCYVSKQIAVKTGIWSRYKGEKSAMEKIDVNINSFITYSKRINETMNSIKNRLIESDQNYQELTFEEITSGFPLKKISRFLNIEKINGVPKVNQKRHNPFPLSDMILNYGELTSYFANIVYEKFLTE